MTGYLRFEGPDGITVLLESEEEDLGEDAGVQKAGLREKFRDGVAVAQDSFEQAIVRIVGAHARVFADAVREIDDPPDEAELTFGLKATGEMGNFVVTKVAGEMNYGVRLVWNARRPDGGQRTDTPQP